MTSAPWYARYFGHDYFQIYEELLAQERAVREASHISDRLALPMGSTILDLCCGHGRHSIELAKLGYRVTGLDLSEVFLERARRDAEAAGVDVRWVHSDMRHIPFEAEFDAVINMFTAFAYLESKAEDQKVLDAVCRALKSGGIFMIDTASREAIMRGYMPYDVTHLTGDIVATHEREFDLRTSRLNDRVTLFHPSGARTEYYTSMRLYTLTEFEEMLGAAGLIVDDYWGGLEGATLHLDSTRLVVRSHKPAR
jgi:SAM-dependent methyltransferase